MTVIAPDPALSGGLVAVHAALPPGPVPFNRKPWDNPIRYRLNRSYGDEFAYDSFAELTRRWRPMGATLPVAGDFDFPGGSLIAWKAATNTQGIVIPAPAGDFEAVLEFAYAGLSGWHNNSSSVMGPALTLQDDDGTGAAAAIYPYNSSFYDLAVTGYVSGAANAVSLGAENAFLDGKHQWLALRRTATTLQARASINGSTWLTLTSGQTVSATAKWLGIANLNPQAGTASGWVNLYRLNVYPGPTFFPG